MWRWLSACRPNYEHKCMYIYTIHWLMLNNSKCHCIQTIWRKLPTKWDNIHSRNWDTQYTLCTIPTMRQKLPGKKRWSVFIIHREYIHMLEHRMQIIWEKISLNTKTWRGNKRKTNVKQTIYVDFRLVVHCVTKWMKW